MSSRSDQLKAAVIKLCLSVNNVKWYDKQVPEEMQVPSMYFPVPISIDSGYTKDNYATSYTQNINLFHAYEWEAYQKAEDIKSLIMKGKSVIPVYAEDGTQDGALFIDNIQISGIDVGVVKLQLQYRDIINYN